MTTDISIEDLWSRLRDGTSIRLVEALGAEYFASAHLPGAVNITARTADVDALALIGGTEPTVVVYSTASSRELAEQVALRLAQLGVGEVRILAEGKERWAELGLPLETA